MNPAINYNQPQKFYFKKNIPDILFNLVLITFVLLNARKATLHFIDYVFILIGVALACQLIFTFLGSVTFVIANGNLIVKTGIGFITQTQTFHIREIQSLKIENKKASTYWGFNGVRLYGTTEVVTFNYQNKEVAIGQNLQNFNEEDFIVQLNNKSNF